MRSRRQAQSDNRLTGRELRRHRPAASCPPSPQRPPRQDKGSARRHQVRRSSRQPSHSYYTHHTQRISSAAVRSDANGYISAGSGRHRSNSGFTLPHWPLPQLPQPMFPSVVPSLTTIVDRVDHCEMRLPASATRLQGGVRGIQIDKEYREFSQIIQSEQLLVLCIIQYFIVLCIYCVLRIVPP